MEELTKDTASFEDWEHAFNSCFPCYLYVPEYHTLQEYYDKGYTVRTAIEVENSLQDDLWKEAYN